ncbi:MAG: hypothetical protein M3P96_12770 [Actinomycetota bacterium]|nr:hypothetical protein [Actinomycetota bacterium]
MDDLVAFALALAVNPSRLLLDSEGGEKQVALTSQSAYPSWIAWQWADGLVALPTAAEAEEGSIDEEAEEDFLRHARPALSRRIRSHPAAVWAGRLRGDVDRLVRHLRDRRPVYQLYLANARRHLERLSGEIDELERQAADDEAGARQ